MENINQLCCNDNKDIINEFFDKFIVMKINLYIDRKDLVGYVANHQDNVIANNLMFMNTIMAALDNIFKSDDFYQYRFIIGNARKIKKLANVIMLLDINRIDMREIDINLEDLINLLLIYINYPDVFQKIYDSETDGNCEYFSVKKNLIIKDSGGSENEYSLSDFYEDYIKNLGENEQFLLNKVFNKINDLNKSEMIVLTSYACFNSDGQKNLEKYLDLIVSKKEPIKEEQYIYYVHLKDRILKNNKDMKSVFTLLNNQNHFMELWRVIVNVKIQEVNYNKIDMMINYALDILPTYSMTYKGEWGSFYGNRETLIFYIMYLLDRFGAFGKDGYFSNDLHYVRNAQRNISQISDWIFGLENYFGKGILDILGKTERGILGFNDLLLFRLKCCANRNNGLYNISNALSKYEGEDAPIEGDTNLIAKDEMRKISQKIFLIFKERYVDTSINIFEQINKLTFDDFCGDIKSNIFSGNNKDETYRLKSQLKSFIIFQLGSTKIDIGVGCGYYDIEDKKDEHGINKQMSKYLFDVCFNVSQFTKNGVYFIEYILLNSWQKSFDFDRLVLEVEHIKGILGKEELISYWRNFGDIIKRNVDLQDLHIHGNVQYTIHDSDLQKLYTQLDNYINLDE